MLYTEHADYIAELLEDVEGEMLVIRQLRDACEPRTENKQCLRYVSHCVEKAYWNLAKALDAVEELEQLAA